MKRKIEEKLLQWADNSKIVIHVATEVVYKVKKRLIKTMIGA